MKNQKLMGGTVHALPDDVAAALGEAGDDVVRAWQDITRLARNEFICQIESVKKPEARRRKIDIAIDKLSHGERQPCCWLGCRYREKNSRSKNKHKSSLADLDFLCTVLYNNKRTTLERLSPAKIFLRQWEEMCFLEKYRLELTALACEKVKISAKRVRIASFGIEMVPPTSHGFSSLKEVIFVLKKEKTRWQIVI